MGWALPFLFMQLFVKIHSAIEFVDVTQGSFLFLSIVCLALFPLFVHVTLNRFSLGHDKERGSREFRERSWRGLGKASR